MTEDIRVKFEESFPPKAIYVFSDENYYLDEDAITQDDVDDFMVYRIKWQGYQQAVKDMEAENDRLRKAGKAVKKEPKT